MCTVILEAVIRRRLPIDLSKAARVLGRPSRLHVFLFRPVRMACDLLVPPPQLHCLLRQLLSSSPVLPEYADQVLAVGVLLQDTKESLA